MSSSASQVQKVKVAVGQVNSQADHEQNFKVNLSLAKQAQSQNCKFLFLPECFAFIGQNQDQTVSQAQSLDGPLMQRYKQLAKQCGIWMSLGGFHEKADDKRAYNTHVIVDSDGNITAVYRKIHLFDVEVYNGPVLKESNYIKPGQELTVCKSPVGMIGVQTCYDMRFPELSQKLSMEMGAQILLYPSAFTVPTGKAHWEILLRARAIENQCYVIAAAQTGKHNDKRESYGHSIIIDCYGKILAEIESEVGIACAEIDLNYLKEVRTRMPIQTQRLQGQKAYLEHKDITRA